MIKTTMLFLLSFVLASSLSATSITLDFNNANLGDSIGLFHSAPTTLDITDGIGGTFTLTVSAVGQGATITLDGGQQILNNDSGIGLQMEVTHSSGENLRLTGGIARVLNGGGDNSVNWNLSSGANSLTVFDSATLQAISVSGTNFVPGGSIGFNTFGEVGIQSLTFETENPLAVVPEPSTYVAMLLGLALLGFRVRKK
ncbi:PEP-CTERM sorting domain-containing protein [Candidatus Uabimicrobium amorphum]|uniref:Ice-binding protein C-terminal domain-containing protein n=1 Tax=Uabimicrobium amorphum TaxID=2596890 RepID=A0A5S9IQ43_UABAM|nr:PEP-CTERM sorting domain-containing protein [Candidatus Uabimicrobium amorphum]BBM85391.1 hypothetical protein UABAM_03758 [Candidatus Uabimicrobium amorphum]